MIYGLVTFTKIKLHPSSSIIRSDTHQFMTHLIFMSEVGKLGGGMWLWGAYQLVLWVFYNGKLIQQQFLLPMTTLET